MGERRLIDANAFLKDILSAGMGRTIIEYSENDIVYMIRKRPTAYAVEVVRCDVCKNAEPYDCTIHGTIRHLYKCKKDEGAIGYNKVVSNYDFCSCGKRKDGDGN